jgi:hypothetical protein
MRHALLSLCLLLPAGLYADDWTKLFNGRDLTGWESVGDGIWTVMRDGTLLGQRAPKSEHQAWLYTKQDFEQFDLELEYWTRHRGNSGVSLRDQTRAKYAVGANWDRDRTPSHNGYEIQISNGYTSDAYPTGSIYLFAKAKTGAQIENDWNRMTIESRHDKMRVSLNGQPVCEHEGDPKRPKTGPIGLQLHDPASVAMFRNIRIRVIR